MYNNYGMDIANLFRKAEEYQKELKHPYVGSEHLLLAILDHDNEITSVLKAYNLTFAKFKDELLKVVGSSNISTNYCLYTPLLKRIIENATNDALDNNKGKVTIRHLFLSMLEEGEGIAIRIMLGLDIDIESIYNELKISLVKTNNKKSELYEIGKSLNQYVDKKEVLIGRDKEIELVIETLLRKKKSNPLLVGKAGVGKTAIVEELARRIELGLVPNALLDKEIVSLEMGALVSGTKYRGEFEERLNKIINEVIGSKNIILFIDEIHTMVNAGGAEGAINASDILKPYLARGSICIIGATTSDEYYNFINKDKALDRRFLKVDILEPTEEETITILKGIKQEYERHHQVKISDKNIEDIVILANKYIKTKNNPDKAIDLLDMICSYKRCNSTKYTHLNKLKEDLQKISNEKEHYISVDNYDKAVLSKIEEDKLLHKINQLKTVNKEEILYDDILQVISLNTNIPLLEDKKEVFKKVSQDLNKNIIGQNDAIKKILKNIWIKLQGTTRPLSLLLTGPSGVGKTKTVKTIASSLFKGNLIRLDMSEYNLETSVNKLIGVSAGYVGYSDDYIFRKVLDNPYSIILVDEIEKASSQVLNLFLQILDEGFATNSKGEKIDFSNTMIFMTSNVVNKKCVGFGGFVDNKVGESFSKEFLGRFDDIINYTSLEESVIKDYIKTNLKNEKIDINDLLHQAECEIYGLRNLEHLIHKYNSEIDIEILI